MTTGITLRGCLRASSGVLVAFGLRGRIGFVRAGGGVVGSEDMGG